MRRLICLLMCFAVMLSLSVTNAFAADGRTVVFQERIQATPGFTVAPGSQITLEVLPESLRPEDNVSLDDFEFRWTLYKGNDSRDLGTGQKITTPPLEESLSKGRISVSAIAKEGTGIIGVDYRVVDGGPEVTIVEDAGVNIEDYALQSSSGMGYQTQMHLAMPDTDPSFGDVYIINTSRPPEGDEWTRESRDDLPSWKDPLASFAWYETDADGNPITGVIGSSTTFHPFASDIGTRYYMCKGYYGLQEVKGTAHYSVRTASGPDLKTVLEPDRVTVGGSMTATALLDGAVINPLDPVFQQTLDEWVSNTVGEEAGCGQMNFDWAGSALDNGALDDLFVNPGTLSNVTSREADASYSYAGHTGYSSSTYRGNVYWETPKAILTVLDADGNIIPPQTSGDGAETPDIDATTFENVFENGGRLTYSVVRDTLQLQSDQLLSIMRGDDDVDFDSWAATGDTFYVANGQGEVQSSGVIVILGDVLGTGTMSLSQVIRTAKAMTGAEPLEGVYAAAADFNGDNSIGITDLVQMANLFKASSSASREYVGKNHELL